MNPPLPREFALRSDLASITQITIFTYVRYAGLSRTRISAIRFTRNNTFPLRVPRDWSVMFDAQNTIVIEIIRKRIRQYCKNTRSSNNRDRKSTIEMKVLLFIVMYAWGYIIYIFLLR